MTQGTHQKQNLGKTESFNSAMDSTYFEFTHDLILSNGVKKDPKMIERALGEEPRVDLHTPKMLIIQFHTSSVWKTVCHTIFIQFQKIIGKRFLLISAAM